MNVNRKKAGMFSKPDESCYRQFVQGLRKADYDLLCLHINLQQYKQTGRFPPFANSLPKVQGVEQDREERMRRESPEGAHAAVSAVELEEEGESKSSSKTSSFVMKADLEEVLKKLSVGQTNVRVEEKSQPKKQGKGGKKKGKTINVGSLTEEELACAMLSMEHEGFEGDGRPKGWTCNNCSSNKHTMVDCPRDLDAAKIAKSLESIRCRRRETGIAVRSNRSIPRNPPLLSQSLRETTTRDCWGPNSF